MASNFYTRKLCNMLAACLAIATLCAPMASAAAAAADDADTQSEPAAEKAGAEKAADKAAAAAPLVKKPYSDEAVKHYNKGVELHQSGFLNQAISEYRGAIEADDRMEEAWSNLGGIYAAQRSYQKAAESFQKALTLKPDRPTTLNGLGTVLYARGKIEEAKAAWRSAILADPKFASAYYNMANALEGEHKNSDAIKEYVKAVTVNPKMGDSFYRIATLYLKDQHLAQARVMFAKAVVLGPEAEYLRDARKQLSMLDSSFAGDAADRRETRTSVSPGTSPVKETSTSTRPAPGKTAPNAGAAATAGSADSVKLRPKASSETPSATTPPKPGINIKTDANGIGTVTEDVSETPKKKKKEKKDKKEKEKKVHKKTEKTESNIADTQAAPPATPSTPAAPTASVSPSTPSEEETRPVAALKKKKSHSSSTAKAPVQTEPPAQDLSPAANETNSNANSPSNSKSSSTSSSTPSAPDTKSTAPSVSPESATDLTGETDGKPVKQKKVKITKVKKPRRDKFTNPEDLAKSFIVQPAEGEGNDSTTSGVTTGTPATSPSGAATDFNAPGGSTMAQPVEPAEKTEMPVPANDSATTSSERASTPATTPAPSNSESASPAPSGDQPATSTDMLAPAATPAATAAPQPAADQGADNARASGKGKHKHVLRKKHDSSANQEVIKAPEPEAGDVSDLREKPANLPPSTDTNMNTETVPGQ